MTQFRQSSAARAVKPARPGVQGYWMAALALSLILNLMLLLNFRARRNAMAASNLPPQNPIAPRHGQRPETTGAQQPAGLDRLEWRWDDLSILDFRTLRSELLAAGCPERTMGAILEVMIDLEYRPRLADLFGQMQANFWDQEVVAKTGRNAPRTAEQTNAEQAFSSLRQERERMMKELVGPDWDRPGSPRFRDSDQVDPRLSFLSEEKRRRIEEQQKAVAELRQHLRSQGVSEADANHQVKALQTDHEFERAEFLSPEEAEEYHLRGSVFNHVVQNLYSFEPSARERQSIIRLHETYGGKVPEAELETALGRERFVQFQRARDPGYESIYKVGSYLNLPEEHFIAAYELKQAAEQQARTIGGRRDLDKSQRAELLRSLQQSTLKDLSDRFGQSGRDLYLKNGGWWIKGLIEPAK